MDKYVLDININSEGGNATNKNVASPSGAKKNEDKSLKDTATSIVGTAQAVGIVKQIFGYKISNVAVRSGNTHAQDKIDFTMSAAGTIVSIGAAFVLNPVLGFLAIASTVVDAAQKFDTYEYNKKWESVGLSQERIRAGASYNRSRGGRGAY